MISRWTSRFLRDKFAMTGLVILVLVFLGALFAPWLAPYNPNATSPDLLLGPNSDYWLGTDQQGRDVLSRLLFASRTALIAGFEAVIIGLVLGIPIGLLIGYFGNWPDRIGMRIIDALMSVPALIIAFAIIAMLGPGLVNAMFAVGIIFAVRLARLVRGLVLSTKEELYIDAARLSGAPRWHIMFRTMLPNLSGPIIVQGALYFSAALLTEAMLSFLGVGVQLPQATWGSMLSEARAEQFRQPFLPFPPALALTVTVLAVNMIADGLRDAMGLSAVIPEDVPELPEVSKSGSAEATDDASDQALSIRNLEVSVRVASNDLPVVRDLDLSVARGEIVGLVGESGSGKSVTALSVLGLLSPPLYISAGAIHFDGQDLARMSERQLNQVRGARIGMVFQNPSAALNPSMRVGAQIAETLILHQNLSKRAALERSVDLLERVGVPNPEQRIHHYPHQFSGGMAQRVVIAMALACNPEVVIADEPTTALDVTTQRQVLQLLRQLVDEFSIGVILITHDMGVVAEVCDRAYVMYAGEIVETGTVHEVFADQKHPYTAALLASTPNAESEPGTPLATIPGRVPNLSERVSGCAFAPRCEFAQAACFETAPQLVTIAGGALSRCIRAEELHELRKAQS